MIGKKKVTEGSINQKKPSEVIFHLKPKEKAGILTTAKPISHQKLQKTEKSAKESSMASEAYLTKDGVKVIDFHPDNDGCLMNKELKDYERDNRHRYIPRNMSQKNMAIQQKIDSDIAYDTFDL